MTAIAVCLASKHNEYGMRQHLGARRLGIEHIVVLLVVVCVAIGMCAVAAADIPAEEQLVVAVQNGDLPEVRRLLREGAYKPGTVRGMKALSAAKTNGHAEIAALLQAEYDIYVESLAESFGESFREGFIEALRQGAAKDPDNPSNRRLLERLRSMDDKYTSESRASREVGDSFRDCRVCPEIVVLPTGEFEMGSPSQEEGRSDWEGPVHRVAMAVPIAMSAHEVTVREFRGFVAETGHSMDGSCWTFDASFEEVLAMDLSDSWLTLRGVGGMSREGRGWRNPGFKQDASHPVVCVSWKDAQAYARWLSKKTGESYRLPSEAEWEYAARAGTNAATYWGDAAIDTCRYSNSVQPISTMVERVLHSAKAANEVDTESAQCVDDHDRTSPVGAYLPNRFGLYDMLGNAWEWTADCWNSSYHGAPIDGSAWQSGECQVRAIRGGSYADLLRPGRSALRKFLPESDRTADLGFRVVRSMRTEWRGAGDVVRTDQIEAPQTGLEVGEHFRDCADCPEVVVVPSGSFRMGSRRGEQGRDRYEGPMRQVTIESRVAIGVYEVTRAEFRRFVAETDHSTGETCSMVFFGDRRTAGDSWRSPGFVQHDTHPVLCVNWHDAKAYTRWLSQKTGQSYRLPSEAEWEYAARAGSTAARHWLRDARSGSWPSASQCAYANGGDRSFSDMLIGSVENPDAVGVATTISAYFASCEDWHHYSAPVGSYRPNDFGLHDTIGNVAEWTEDCWNKNYRRAPKDVQAWTAGNCQLRVARGGSYMSQQRQLRSAHRLAVRDTERRVTMGFRVVRSLDLDPTPRVASR